MILTDPNDFRIKNHDFSASATNCRVLVIEAVQNVKITIFRQLHCADRFFVTFCDFCRVPIEDFPKNHDSEHDFDDQHEVNGKST